MKIIRLLTVSALAFSTASHAWTWRWMDKDGERYHNFGTKSLSCSKMEMPKNSTYSWENDGSIYCVHVYRDDSCKYSNGWSCIDWGPRKLSQPWVRSYKVNTIDGYGNDRRKETTTNGEPEPTETDETSGTGSEMTVTATSSAATETTNSSTSTGDTETSAPTATESSAPSTDESSLSGGAIAGVVVGTCAGVGVMALFGLLAYRRRRASSTRIQSGSFHGGDHRPGELGPPPSPPPAPKNHYPELDSTPATPNPHLNPSTAFTPTYPVAQPSAYPAEKGAQSTVPYMSNKKHMVELADTSRIPEMDASRGKEW